jgi:spoIIIJ-associated protein
MRSVEVAGGSIDEAIDRALQVLGAARDQVEIDILENATRGLLGIGRRRARVRATMRAPFHAADGGSEPLEHEAPAATKADRFDGVAFLSELLRRMSFDARVHSSVDAPGSCVLEIESADAAVLAACRDDVRAALEFLVNRIAERQAKEKTRFVVASPGGRARGDLPTLARRLAERARTRGAAVAVDVVGEDERRVVTEALRGERGITLRTTGSGPQRKLLIIPGRRRRGGGATGRGS